MIEKRCWIHRTYAYCVCMQSINHLVIFCCCCTLFTVLLASLRFSYHFFPISLFSKNRSREKWKTEWFLSATDAVQTIRGALCSDELLSLHLNLNRKLITSLRIKTFMILWTWRKPSLTSKSTYVSVLRMGCVATRVVVNGYKVFSSSKKFRICVKQFQIKGAQLQSL